MARSHFTTLQIWRQRFQIAEIADSDNAHWFMRFRDRASLACFGCIESSHQMDKKIEGCCLNCQILSRQANIVNRMMVYLSDGFKVPFGNGKHQYGRALSPMQVVSRQATQQALVIFRAFSLGCEKKTPRLFIVGGWRPSRCLKQLLQFLHFNRAIRESKRAAAPPQAFFDRVFGIREL